jgi:hypothetical protein
MLSTAATADPELCAAEAVLVLLFPAPPLGTACADGALLPTSPARAALCAADTPLLLLMLLMLLLLLLLTSPF